MVKKLIIIIFYIFIVKGIVIAEPWQLDIGARLGVPFGFDGLKDAESSAAPALSLMIVPGWDLPLSCLLQWEDMGFNYTKTTSRRNLKLMPVLAGVHWWLDKNSWLSPFINFKGGVVFETLSIPSISVERTNIDPIVVIGTGVEPLIFTNFRVRLGIDIGFIYERYIAGVESNAIYITPSIGVNYQF